MEYPRGGPLMDNVILLTPRYSGSILTDPREEPLCTFEADGPDWVLMLRLGDELLPIPVQRAGAVGAGRVADESVALYSGIAACVSRRVRRSGAGAVCAATAVFRQW